MSKWMKEAAGYAQAFGDRLGLSIDTEVVDADTFYIGNTGISIMQEEFEEPCLVGNRKYDGYVVYGDHYYPGDHISPPDVDVDDISNHRCLRDAVSAAIMQHVGREMTHIKEDWDAKIWDREIA